MEIPTLVTERLCLRGWRDSDVDPIAAYEADPQAMRYIGDGAVHDRGHASSTIAAFRAD